MRYTTLGDTDLNISLLGLGTVKFGRNTGVKYPEAFELPDRNQMRRLLDIAQAGGINLIDTAPAYGDSELKLGQLLKGEREDWIICTKAGEQFDPETAHSTFDFRPEAITRSVEQSLKRLGVEVLDIVLIHSNGDDESIIQQYGALDTLARLKQKGWIRASGMSTKTPEGGILALQHSDCAMVTLNPEQQQDKQVIDYAFEHNKGILIKKLLNSGHAANTANGLRSAIQQAKQIPGIHSVIMGTTNPDHLRQNIALFTDNEE